MALNYAQYMPNINSGISLQEGIGLANIANKQQQQQEDKATALAKEQQYNTDVLQAMQDGSPKAMANLIMKYPQQREAFKTSFDIMGEEQKKNEILKTGQVYNALLNDNVDVAKNIIKEQITATENAEGDTTKLNSILDYINKDPKGARGYAGMILSSVMTPEDFTKTFSALGTERREDEMIPIKLEEVLTKKDANRLRAMEASLRREDNDLKRQELQLKIDEMRTKADTKIKEKVSEASGALETFDRAINTIGRIMDHPGLETATGWSNMVSMLPGTDASDAAALIETLKSQAFSSEVAKMKGLGGLSESEGEKLSSSVANLDRSQSTGAFKKNLKVALDIFTKAKSRAEEKYSGFIKKEEPQEKQQVVQTENNTNQNKSYLKYGQ